MSYGPKFNNSVQIIMKLPLEGKLPITFEYNLAIFY